MPDLWGQLSSGLRVMERLRGRNKNILQCLWSPREVQHALLWAARLWTRWRAVLSAGISGNSILSCTSPKGSTPHPLGESSRADEFSHPLLICNYSSASASSDLKGNPGVAALISQELILNCSTESNIKAVISITEQSQTQQANSHWHGFKKRVPSVVVLLPWEDL